MLSDRILCTVPSVTVLFSVLSGRTLFTVASDKIPPEGSELHGLP